MPLRTLCGSPIGGAALIGLVWLLCACCSTPPDGPETPPTTGATPTKNLAWDRPEAQPPQLRSLGQRPWTTAIATISGDALVHATPDQIIRGSGADGPGWTTTVKHRPQFMAWSADGKTLGALTHRSDGEWIAILDAATGELLHETMAAALRSPSIERGIQPPARPTGFLGAPDGSAFWVQNPYGTHEIKQGEKNLRSVTRVPEYARRIEGARQLLAPSNRSLEPVGGGNAIDLGCYAQWHVAHATHDRVLARCVAPKEMQGLHLFSLSTGERLSAWKQDGFPLGILSPTEVVFEAKRPQRIAKVKLGGDEVQWLSGSSGFRHVTTSPSGNLVAGWSYGNFQVLDVKSGKVVCDDVRAGSAIGVGPVSDAKAWLLTYLPGKTNQLALRDLDLATCEAGEPIDLGIGKTTNLLPRWLPKAKAFVLLALHGKGDYGPVTVPVEKPGTFQVLPGGNRTPTFSASADGSRVAFWTSDSASVVNVGPKPLTQASWGGALGVAMCDGHEVHADIRGWTVYKNGQQVREFGGPQPDAVTCAGERLYVQRSGALYSASIKDGVWRAIETRARAVASTPHGLVLATGATGWSIRQPL